jgi:hypothetical protein
MSGQVSGSKTAAAFEERVLRDCLSAFPEVVFAVTGQCMSPDLADGARVKLVSPRRHRPRLGDVVLTSQAGELRLHRLVWGPPLVGGGAGWRTKADRARVLDPSLAEDDVLGTVVAVEGRRHPRKPVRAILSLAHAAVARVRATRGAR